MLDKYLRTLKEEVLIPVVDVCFSSVSPNSVTLFAGIVGIASAVAAAKAQYSAALGLWAGNRILDGLDGVIARRFGKQTDFGGYLDIVVDFVVYAIIPIGLTWSQRHSPDAEALWLTLALLLSTYFVNAAGLFNLAAILEKQKMGAKQTNELTSVSELQYAVPTLPCFLL
jgi:phosphatidylglycerophosphate synthase